VGVCYRDKSYQIHLCASRYPFLQEILSRSFSSFTFSPQFTISFCRSFNELQPSISICCYFDSNRSNCHLTFVAPIGGCCYFTIFTSHICCENFCYSTFKVCSSRRYLTFITKFISSKPPDVTEQLKDFAHTKQN
jgi:hypothetical protein